MLTQRDEALRFSYDKRTFLHFLGRRFMAAIGRGKPLLAYLKVTRRCNLDCGYCPWHTHATETDGELDTARWMAIIDDLAERGVHIFVFEGGEPTLRADLQQLLDHVERKGGFSILATNGTGTMNRFRPSAFTVSVDGPEAVHDAIRGAGTYQRLRRNLERRGSDRAVTITVISRMNAAYIEELVEEMSPIVDGFLFTFLYPYSKAVSAALPRDEMTTVKERLLALKKRHRILNTRKQLASKNGWTCYDTLTLSVDYRGTIRDGCFVDHVEERNCADCELGCYQLISSFHEFNYEAWFNLHRLLLARV